MDTAISDRLVGQLLDGRYRVEARIARGGMATVYTALDTRLDRVVALKVMHPNLADDPDFVERFNREAKAAARLSHPHVVSVYDQGAADGHVFLVMEYVEGRTLRDLLRERGRLTAGQALSVIEPVLMALKAAHAAGIIHRDVKPENVLLADDGRVKVADFGLARAVTTSTSTSTTGVLIGTVAYLAPEQVEHGTADARSDVYASGVLLYEMLVGRPPYDGETAMAVAFRHVHEDVPPPSTVVAGVPPVLDEVVRDATRRDPDSRPADAGALLTRVTAAKRSLAETDPAVATDTVVVPRPAAAPSTQTQVLGPPLAPAGGPSSPPRERRRRRRGPIVIAAVIVLALVAAGLGYWFAAGRYTHVPSVLEKSVAEAKTLLRAKGFHVKEGDGRFSGTIPKGEVAAQSPGPNGRIRSGGTVTIYPSLGLPTVPDVRGRTEADARTMLTAAHLSVGEVTRAYSLDVKTGRVISTSPDHGATAQPGQAVDLVVSQGPQPVRVPDETGKSESEARSVLEGLNLRVVVTRAFDDTVPVGDVIDQSPKSGTVDAGSRVTLTVSKGPEMVTVPDLYHHQADEAVAELDALGLKAHVHQLNGGPGEVISQNPKAGTSVKKGSTVDLYVF